MFTDADFHGVEQDQDSPMVITVELKNFIAKKVLVDQGSLVDILYRTTYKKMSLPIEVTIPHDEPIYGFFGEKVCTRG